jgi:hypothetical protein
VRSRNNQFHATIESIKGASAPFFICPRKAKIWLGGLGDFAATGDRSASLVDLGDRFRALFSGALYDLGRPDPIPSLPGSGQKMTINEQPKGSRRNSKTLSILRIDAQKMMNLFGQS